MTVSCIQVLMVCHTAASYSRHSLAWDVLRQVSTWCPWMHLVRTDQTLQQGRKQDSAIIHRHYQRQVPARISLHWSVPVRMWPLETHGAEQHVLCSPGCTTGLVVAHLRSKRVPQEDVKITRKWICAGKEQPTEPRWCSPGSGWTGIAEACPGRSSTTRLNDPALPVRLPRGGESGRARTHRTACPAPRCFVKVKSRVLKSFHSTRDCTVTNPACLLQMNQIIEVNCPNYISKASRLPPCIYSRGLFLFHCAQTRLDNVRADNSTKMWWNVQHDFSLPCLSCL